FLYSLSSLTYIDTYSFFSYTDTPTPDIYSLSLHDALPILGSVFRLFPLDGRPQQPAILGVGPGEVYVQKRTRGKGVVPISLADFSICVRWSIGEEKSPRAWRRVGLVHVFRDEKMYRPHTTSA